MEKIAIITDSNSGITEEEAKELQIYVIPMPFTINENEYFEDIDLTKKQFYEIIENGVEISTSQPAVGNIIDMWDNLLKAYDSIVYIPMSSGLSGSCATAQMLSLDYDGKVQVVNNQRIAPTLRQSVLDAITLQKKGKTAIEIKEILEKTKFDSSIYITVDSLKYLKKGGRITSTVAAIGTVLNLKPILQIQGEKLDAYSKSRGMKQAKKVMIDAIKSDMDNRFLEYFGKNEMELAVAHSNNLEMAKDLKSELEKVFPNKEIHITDLPLSIACHIGPGALAIATCRKL